MRGFRHALRSLARTPLFTATALLILSLSVGATAAIFSMLHALVLRPVAAPRPHELVQLTTFNHRGQNTDLTWRQYRELHARQQVFKSLFASIQQGVFTVETGRSTVRASIAGVSGNYFGEFEARPALGRLIEPSDLNESAISGEPVVVISWTFWQREFGGAPDVIGRTITADLVPLTIVGVTARDFLGLSIAIEHDVTVPIPLIPKISQSEASMLEGTSSWVAVTGRLRDEVTLPEARAQLLALWPGILAAAAPQQFRTSQREEYLKRTLSVDSGATGWERGLRNRYTRALYVLQGIAAIVLLIAGANLCSLIVTRADARRHELAVRLALGSSRRRLIGEQTLEGAILGIGGAAGGLALAALASNSLAAFLLRDYGVPTAFDASPDRLVVTVAAASGIGTAVTVTAAAGWLATRRHVALTSGSRTVARTSVVGRVLVGAQVALSIVLLSHASLLTRSVTAMVSEDSGLTKRHLLMGFPTERVGKYRDLDPAVYYPQALERVRAVPGVEAAAFITSKPHGGATPFELTGRAGTPIGDTDLTAEQAQVSPGFLETVEIPLLRGRDFTIADTAAAMKVAILSETLERRLFGEGRGLGERIRISRRPEWQDALVVGIARDARLFDVRGGNVAIAYTPAVQSGQLAHFKFLVARASAHASADVQHAVDDLGVEYVRRFQTLDYARGRTILQERLMAGLSAFFGALALLLVSVGVYGLLSYILSLRRKELGIRLALGAKPARVAGQITGSVLLVVAIGLIAGITGSILTAPLLRSVLVATSPYDPVAIGAAAIILIGAGAVATAGPAVRAARVQPITELRQD
jgi:putative ABC transport system permease protein